MKKSAVNCFGFSVENDDGLQHFLRYKPNRSYALSAHRGGAQLGFPENCIATFENTLKHGCAMLEIDPRLTKDGAIVLHHDQTLHRTTSGTGRLRDRTLAELQELTLLDLDGNTSEFKMPTLKQAIDWARDKTILVIDQKDVPLDQRIAAISDNNAEGFVMLIISSLKHAEQVHKANPKIMMEIMVPDLKRVSEIDKSGLPWRNLIAFVGHQPPRDPDLIKAIHQRGAMCMAGTSRHLDRELANHTSGDKSIKGYQNLLDFGIDVLETDLPIQVHKLLQPN